MGIKVNTYTTIEDGNEETGLLYDVSDASREELVKLLSLYENDEDEAVAVRKLDDVSDCGGACYSIAVDGVSVGRIEELAPRGWVFLPNSCDMRPLRGDWDELVDEVREMFEGAGL
jgi:hypothetical protein